MRTEEQTLYLYQTYLKKCALEKERYEAGYDPYFYGLAYGAATALGLTLGLTMAKINRDLARAERRWRK